MTPALFILVSVAFVVALLLDPAERKNALYGLAILGTGLLYYWGWHIGHRSGKANAAAPEQPSDAASEPPAASPDPQPMSPEPPES